MPILLDKIYLLLWVIATTSVFNALHLPELQEKSSAFSMVTVFLFGAAGSASIFGLQAWVKERGLSRRGWGLVLLYSLLLYLCLVIWFYCVSHGVRYEVSLATLASLPVFTRFWSAFLDYQELEKREKWTFLVSMLTILLLLLRPWDVMIHGPDFSTNLIQFYTDKQFMLDGGSFLALFGMGLFFSLCRKSYSLGVSTKYLFSLTSLIAGVLSFPLSILGELSFFNLTYPLPERSSMHGIFYNHPGFSRGEMAFSFQSVLMLSVLFGILFLTMRSYLHLQPVRSFSSISASRFWSLGSIFTGLTWVLLNGISSPWPSLVLLVGLAVAPFLNGKGMFLPVTYRGPFGVHSPVQAPQT
jgi:hypothetical protein